MHERRRSDVPILALDIRDVSFQESVEQLVKCEASWSIQAVTDLEEASTPFAALVGRGADVSARIAQMHQRFPGCCIIAAAQEESSTCAELFKAGAAHVLPASDATAFAKCALVIIERGYRRMLPFGLMPQSRAFELPSPLAFVDRSGIVQLWNKEACNLFGISSDEACGRHIDTLLGTKPSIMARLNDSRERMNSESVLQRLPGKELTCQWRASRIGRGEGWGIVFDDISERVQVETDLREAIRAADAANRAKSEFLAVMSHEIRTPMNSIVGFTELLIDGELQDSQRDYLEIVRSNGLSLLELINNILEFSRIESGKVNAVPAVVDVRDLMAEIVDSLWVDASKKGIQLYSHVGDDVPRRVRTIENELRRILINLTANAVKFTERGSVQLFLNLLYTNDSYQLLFKVNDTGIGIPREKTDRLFKTFSQIDSSSTRKHGGTGLGLAISKKLCEAMGGRMWVQSIPGKGSTFFFTVPLDAVDPIELPAKPDETEKVPPHSDESATECKPLRVLVAEDEPMNQLLVQRFLHKLGHIAELAPNGAKAIERLRKGVFDMVLMDIQMPEMDGLKAAELIREGHAGEEKRGTFICALTAYAMAGDQERCMQVGMNDYLSKPLSINNLKRVLDRVLIGLGSPQSA